MKGIPCLFNLITGLYCPGCGITRMVISILKLDFYQAFRYNQLVFALLILAICYYTYKLTVFLIYKRTVKIKEPIMYILLITIIAFGVLRNIEIFSFLKPTII